MNVGTRFAEIVYTAQPTLEGAVAFATERLADAIEARFRAGAVDVMTLHGLGNPDQEDLLLNGLLPELRRRALIDADYVGADFRSNLELPPLRLAAAPPRAARLNAGLAEASRCRRKNILSGAACAKAEERPS